MERAPRPRACVAAKLGGSKAVTIVMEDLCEALDTFDVDFTEGCREGGEGLGAPDSAAVQAVSPRTPLSSGMPLCHSLHELLLQGARLGHCSAA